MTENRNKFTGGLKKFREYLETCFFAHGICFIEKGELSSIWVKGIYVLGKYFGGIPYFLGCLSV